MMSEKNMVTAQDQLIGSPSIMRIFHSLNIFFWKILSLNNYSFYTTKNNFKKAEKAKRYKTHIIGLRPWSLISLKADNLDDKGCILIEHQIQNHFKTSLTLALYP